MNIRSALWPAATLAALAMLVGTTGARAALGDHVWSTGYETSEASLAVDAGGNTAVYGTFFGTVDFGGGTLTSANFFDGDQCLAKLDADGNHLWSRQFTPGGFGVGDECLAVDPAGNVYVAGFTYSGASLDLGGGAIGGQQLYVAKFGADGVFQWSRACGFGYPSALAADNGRVVVVGYSSGTPDFGGGPVGGAGGNDVVIAEFTAAGAHSWSAAFGDASGQGALDVAVDASGRTLVLGTMFGGTDFGGGILTANLLDLFLVSFGPGGSHLWSQVFDGTFTPGGGILATCAVACGPGDTVAIVGEKLDGVDFGGGALPTFGFGDVYAAVFDAGGAHQWSDAWGSTTGTDRGNGVAFDADGNLLVAGTMAGTVDFGGGPLPFTGNPAWGANNLYLAAFDPVGAHVFSGAWGEYVYESGCAAGGGVVMLHGTGPSVDLGGGEIPTGGLFLGRMDGGGGGASAVHGTPTVVSALRGHPNPFNPTTTIEYEVARPTVVSVAAYDLRGRLVQDLAPARLVEAGVHRVRFSPAASGTYLVRVRAGDAEHVVKMTAVK